MRISIVTAVLNGRDTLEQAIRLSGASNRSLKNMWIKSSEDYKAWKVNNLDGGLYTILLKNVSKIPQFFMR